MLNKWILAALGVTVIAVGAFFINQNNNSPEALAAAIAEQDKGRLGDDVIPPLGQASAKVKVVEYADFDSSGVRHFFQNGEKSLRSKYVETGKVALYWRNYPPEANSSNASRCAAEQGKFWEYHDKLLAAPDNYEWDMNRDAIVNVAKDLGLDMTKFNDCFDGAKSLAMQKDFDSTAKLGLYAMVFSVNGVNVFDSDNLGKTIDAELAKAANQ